MGYVCPQQFGVCFAVLAGNLAASTGLTAAGRLPALITAAPASGPAPRRAPAHASAPTASGLLQRMPLSAITFSPTSDAAGSAFLDQEFIRSLRPEDLLVPFWIKVGDPRATNNTGFPGSWEDHSFANLSGQFTGHWLSASARTLSNRADPLLKASQDMVVRELAIVQAKDRGVLFPYDNFLLWLATGELGTLDNLIWVVPLYDIHKMYAGMLDVYHYNGNQQALDIVIKMTDVWLIPYVDTILANGTHWQDYVLQIEYGGMQESLFKLYQLTGDTGHLRMATAFTRDDFFVPTVKGVDTLNNRHANTMLAQVNGYAACYEVTGNESCRSAVLNFVDMLVANHSWPTGGSNAAEHWGEPMRMGTLLDEHPLQTQETCTAYNTMKILESCFRWSLDPQYVDLMERLQYGGIVGTQRMPPSYMGHNAGDDRSCPATGRHLTRADRRVVNLVSAGYDRTQISIPDGPGLTLTLSLHSAWATDYIKPGPAIRSYMTPLGSGVTRGGSDHGWGGEHALWCCHGTGIESTAMLPEHFVYFREACSPDDLPSLYFAMYDSYTLDMADHGLAIDMEASMYEESSVATINITFRSSVTHTDNSAAALPLRAHFRIPTWAHNATVSNRGWLCPGDTINLELPMLVRLEHIRDDRAEYRNLQAIIVGNLLMSGITNDTRAIRLSDNDPTTSLTSVPSIHDFVSLFTLDPICGKGVCANFEQCEETDLVEAQYAGDILFMRLDRHHVVATPNIPDVGAAMDTTFRFVRAYNRVPWRKLLPLGQSGPQPGDRISLESMTLPGSFVGVDARGVVVVQRDDGSEGFIGNHTFIVHEGRDGKRLHGTGMSGGTISLELLARPGHFVTAPPVQPNSTSGRQGAGCSSSDDAWADDPDICVSLKEAGPDVCRGSHAEVMQIHCRQGCQTCDVLNTAFTLQSAGASMPEASSFWTSLPVGRHPAGSKILLGEDRQYVVSPLNKVVDEPYTAFFEVTQ